MTRAAKVPVSMSLGEDLVREARSLTSDLSGTVEGLLATYIAKERSTRADEPLAIDTAIAATNDFVEQYGLPGTDHAPV
jgi:post-segregation antitoxin (ccd killing protein)